MQGETKYRVERWVDYADPKVAPWKYKEHHFDTWEEVEKYIEIHNAVYRLKIFKYVEEEVDNLPATHEFKQMTDEEVMELMDS